jgi:hypothetical protein
MSKTGHQRTLAHRAPLRQAAYSQRKPDDALVDLQDFVFGDGENLASLKWLAFTPHELVRAHLKIDESVLAKIPPRKMPVVGASNNHS